MKKSKSLLARFLITSPMYLWPDGPQAGESIRTSSVKGALRFWWRACRYGHLRNAAESPENALRELHAQEDKLFGAAAKNGKGGQGDCLISVSPDPEMHPVSIDAGRLKGWQYLLGQGLYGRQNEKKATHRPGCFFNVRCSFRPTTTPAQMHSVAEALLAWGCLGGLGSRSRRAVGSVSIQELDSSIELREGLAVPAGLEDFASLVRRLTALALPGQEQAPFTALWNQCHICQTHKSADLGRLLDNAGAAFRSYRSYYPDRGDPRRFPEDHDNVLHFADRQPLPANSPRLAVFGLPHNYFFRSARVNVDIQLGNPFKRRASPLLMHVHSFPGRNAEYYMIQSMIPATFLPQEKRALHVKSKYEAHSDFRPDWSVITDYLESLNPLTIHAPEGAR